MKQLILVPFMLLMAAVLFAQTKIEPDSLKIGDRGPGGGLVFHIEGNRYLEASEYLGEEDWYDAEDLATDYRGGGYADWYLPSKDELNYIYENLRVKDFISDNGWLWSSSEFDDNSAWSQRFRDGSQYNGSGKPRTYGVRAVRAFTSYKIGDRGPGGGLVFYIEGNTYLEASESLGEVYWSDAKDLAKDSHGGYDDWYLPSKDELNYIYENLRVKGFISDNGWFWSSSEYSVNYAWYQRFSDGSQTYDSSSNYKYGTLGVRAVRAFTISSGEIAGTAKAESEPKPYKIGDRGPGGGLVFYIEGNTYLEASESLGEVYWWDAKDLAKDSHGGYDDWYLPSKEELNYIYENLRVKGFISDNGWFWSSSETNNGSAWGQRFSDGYQLNYSYDYKNYTLGVRAVRAFYISSGKIAVTAAKTEREPSGYKIGDKGPGGGLVFYIEGNTYLEASEYLGEADWWDAKDLATDYRGGGYADWYLPSKDELNYIYENLRVKGFISDDGWLWSSSEYNSSNAWSQRFSDGNQDNFNSYNKSLTLGVRAVRAFNPFLQKA